MAHSSLSYQDAAGILLKGINDFFGWAVHDLDQDHHGIPACS